MSGVGASKDDIHSNSVLINIFHSFLGVKSVMTLFRDRYKSHLNVEVSSKFLKSNLGISTHDNVWAGFVDRFSSSLALLLPDALHGKTAKLNGFGRASSGRSNSLLSRGSIPEVSNNRDTTSVDNLS